MNENASEGQPVGNQAIEKMPPLPAAPPDAKKYYEDDRAGNFILWKYGYNKGRDTWTDNDERVDFVPPQHVETIQLRSQIWDEGDGETSETRVFFFYDPEIAAVEIADISGDEGKERMRQLLEDGYSQEGELFEQPEGRAMYLFAKTVPKPPGDNGVGVN